MTNTVKKSLHKELLKAEQTKRLSSVISTHSLVRDIPKFIKGLRISSARAFHASRFQSQVEEKLKTIRVISGLKHLNVLTSYDPNTQSWKMSQGLFQNHTSIEFSGIWPKSGIMLFGRVYPLQMWEPATREKDCSSWLTPSCTNIEKRSDRAMIKRKKYRESVGRKTVPPGNLAEQVNMGGGSNMFPTPTICGNNNKKGVSKTSGDGLATAVKKMFPTPKAQNKNLPAIHGEGGLDLQTYVQKYPTPTNSMMAVGDMEQAKYSGNDSKRPIYKKVTSSEGQLNPDWVEWLMGWPIGWSDIKPLKKLKIYDISVDPFPEIQRVTALKENRTKRLKAIGNGQVPIQISVAFTALYKIVEKIKRRTHENRNNWSE